MNKDFTALITGASGGIGLALANTFAKNGYGLVLIARNQQKLDAVKNDLESKYKVRVKTLAKDLGQREAAQEIFNQLNSENIEIDTLVNNAGFAEYGEFASVPSDKQLAMVNLNIYTLTALTSLFLPSMLSRTSGKILNVASTAAFQPGPYMAVYYASKAYVLSFSEALRAELKNLGIAVTALCPGPTKTDFAANSELSRSRLLKYAQSMSAERVAEAAFSGLVKNKAVVIPGFVNKFLAFGTRLMPRKLLIAISKWTLQLIK